MATLTDADIRRLELLERLDKALEILLAGDQRIPAEDPLDEDALAALSNEELVRRTYTLVGYVDDPLSDYRLLGECFERFAPDAEWANRVVAYEGDGLTYEELERELEPQSEGLVRRAALRKAARDG